MAAMVGSLTAAAGAKCDFYGRISTVASMGFELMKRLDVWVLNVDSTNPDLHDKDDPFVKEGLTELVIDVRFMACC